MAESQSGSPSREAEGKRAMPGPGKKATASVIARSAATKQSRNGQPEMRQA